MNRRDTTALTLQDYARLARARLDPPVWDFFDGGAGEEQTLAANLAAFDRVRFRPRVLRGTVHPELETRILGRTWEVPLAIAPMAYQTMAAPEGELALVRGTAAAAAIPVVISTFAGRTVEEVADGAAVPLWLQVYCFRDRSVTRRLIERAEGAGFEALVLTVDAPRLGRRLRDVRNDFRLPPGVFPANLIADGAADPSLFSSPGAHALTEFDPGLDWSVIDWLRSVSSLPILLKGILTAQDARRSVGAGADGIVVSNHGGRQLDGVPASLDVLPEIVAAVAGRIPVLVDGGIRRGRDVLAARALGADAVLLGRPVLHGLAVAQHTGVTEVLNLLIAELTESMILMGLDTLAAAGPELIQLSVPASAPAPAPAPVLAQVPGETPFAPGELSLPDLHSSVSDPVMDTMNFLNEITLRYPQAISFAPGRPYGGFLDAEQIFGYLRRYLDYLSEQGRTPDQLRDALFQYGPAAGQIRELIAQSLRVDEGIDVPPESIVVTVGAQEAMFLVLRALIRGPEDAILVSSPAYVGITGAARLLDIEVTAVNEREDGFCCADLEAAIQAERARGRRVRAVYVIPDHSNPSGLTMTLTIRQDLLDLASRYDFLIVEDSPYRLVSPGVQVPTVKSLDHDRRVIHLGSYSKTVFPGTRVGFAVADQPILRPGGGRGLLADELAKIKSMLTVNTSPLSQAAVAGALLSCDGMLSKLNSAPAAYYGDAMEFTLGQLERRFPADLRERLGTGWNSPSGGFFLSMTVPFTVDNAALTRSAQDFGVLWTPMSYFYPQGGGEKNIRLSISYLSHAEIEAGVARLADFIQSEVGRVAA